MTRSGLIELVVALVVALLGYGATSFAQGTRPLARPTVIQQQNSAPTATVAPAVTFTPASTVVVVTPSFAAVPSATSTATTPTATTTARAASPTPSRTPTRAPTPVPTPITYVVRAGDSLDGIAREFGVSADQIAQTNHLADPNSLAEGQKLIIPRK